MKVGPINTLFEPGQIVYLKVDPEWCGMITAIVLRPGNALNYYVTWSDHEEFPHYECELTEEKGFIT